MKVQNKYSTSLEVGAYCVLAYSLRSFNAKYLADASRKGLIMMEGSLVFSSFMYHCFRDYSDTPFSKTIVEKGLLFTATSFLCSKTIAPLPPRLALTASASSLLFSIVVNQIVYKHICSSRQPRSYNPCQDLSSTIGSLPEERARDWHTLFSDNDTLFDQLPLPLQSIFYKRFKEVQLQWNKGENLGENLDFDPAKISINLTSKAQAENWFALFSQNEMLFKELPFPFQFAFCKQFNFYNLEWKKSENIYEKFAHPTDILSNPQEYTPDDRAFFIQEIWGYRRMPLYNEGQTTLIREIIGDISSRQPATERTPLFYFAYSLLSEWEKTCNVNRSPSKSDVSHPYGYWQTIFLSGILPPFYVGIKENRLNHVHLSYHKQDQTNCLSPWLVKSSPDTDPARKKFFDGVKNRDNLNGYELAAAYYFQEENRNELLKQSNQSTERRYSFDEAREWFGEVLKQRNMVLKMSDVFAKAEPIDLMKEYVDPS